MEIEVSLLILGYAPPPAVPGPPAIFKVQIPQPKRAPQLRLSNRITIVRDRIQATHEAR